MHNTDIKLILRGECKTTMGPIMDATQEEYIIDFLKSKKNLIIEKDDNTPSILLKFEKDEELKEIKKSLEDIISTGKKCIKKDKK